MENEMMKLLEGLAAQLKEMKAGQDEMKAGQEEMKAGQEEMKAGQVEMRAGQENLKEEMKATQENLKEEIKATQEEIKANQNEMKTHMESQVQGIKELVEKQVERIEEEMKGVKDEFTGVKGEFEEVKGEMKEVNDKIDTLEKKMEILETKNLEENFGKIEEKIDQMLEKKLSSTAVLEDVKCVPVTSRPLIKLSTYDGKSSWKVYKTQFAIVANANGWDSVTKACQLAASLRAEAADILQTLPEEQRLDFNSLSSALELRFGEKCVKDYSRLQLKSRQQKPTETLQELATDVERLSHLAFADCPAETREILSLQYFIDGIRDVEIQKALRMADVKDLQSALVYAMKYEAAQQATRRERHPIRATTIQEPDNSIAARIDQLERKINNLRRSVPENKQSLKCWSCGSEGHIRRNCRTRQDEKAKAAPRREQGN